MKRLFAVTAALVLLGMGLAAQAAITIETVPVGNVGNAPDTRVMDDGTTGYGSVGYNYSIGKYEVTAGQYTAFLNAVAATDTYGLYNTKMDTVNDLRGCNIKRTGASGNYSYSVASDWANRPVNYVSWYDTLRFANWLTNGQGSGSTESGSYLITGGGVNSGTVTIPTAAQRKTWYEGSTAKWLLTSENEWYKAAYYKGGSTSAGYWLYPTQSNTAPANQVLATDPGNSANYVTLPDETFCIGGPYSRTNVGEFENSASAYGTFDQGGNVFEWNEAIVYAGYADRGVRGGAFNSPGDYHLRASCRASRYVSDEDRSFGFRVSAVPEPSSLIALAGGLVGLLGMRRRRA